MEVQYQFTTAKPASPDESGRRGGGQGVYKSSDGKKNKLTAFIQTAIWIHAQTHATNVNV